jgi:MarR family transcriptional regulator for hemolysin
MISAFGEVNEALGVVVASNLCGTRLQTNEWTRRVIAKPRNRKRSTALKLIVVARHLRQSFDQSVERSGLTRAKWTLIAAVAHKPGATQRVIAEALEVREVTAGRLIDRLCAEGYLTRREHPTDGRAYCVYLAPGAQPVLDTLGELGKMHEATIFAGFGSDDLEKLNALLDAIARNLSSAARIRSDAKK